MVKPETPALSGWIISIVRVNQGLGKSVLPQNHDVILRHNGS